METEEVIRLLSHYRHDIMNQLQIIQGYLGMNKTDRVQSKVTDYVDQLKHERLLINLEMPHFALWVIRFNTVYDNFRLTYDIGTDQKPSLPDKTDQQLEETCGLLFETLKTRSHNGVLYEAHLQVKEIHPSAAYTIQITIQGAFPETVELENKLHQILPSVSVQMENDCLVCVITIESDE